MYLAPNLDPATGAFGGLTLVVRDERKPGLRFEYGGGRRVRLSKRGGPLLWARAEPCDAGVWTLRRTPSGPLAIAPPITAADVARSAGVEDWMKWLARALDVSDTSPLGAGTWQLTELVPSAGHASGFRGAAGADSYRGAPPDSAPEHWVYGLRDALNLPRVHHEGWIPNGSGRVSPLREPSASDASRVKSWRKHARAGTLPPIMLWWARPLDMPLIIDGHDRLQAAAAEGVQPRAIVLWQVFEQPLQEPLEWRDALVRQYERAFESEEKLSDGTRARLNRSLDQAFRPWRYPITSAVARRGLEREWLDEVRTQLADEPELCAAMCGDVAC